MNCFQCCYKRNFCVQTHDDLVSFTSKLESNFKASVFNHSIFAISPGIKAKMLYLCLISRAYEILRTKVQ